MNQLILSTKDEIGAWMLLWQIVFIVGVTVFAGMTVWVTVAGYRDIKRLIEKIKKSHEEE